MYNEIGKAVSIYLNNLLMIILCFALSLIPSRGFGTFSLREKGVFNWAD
jgi:hypothetical protein